MDPESLFEFPCRFPVKVMGRHASGFAELARAIVEQHAGPIEDGDVSERASRGGNFVALTFIIEAHSKNQLDALYEALSANRKILVAL